MSEGYLVDDGVLYWPAIHYVQAGQALVVFV